MTIINLRGTSGSGKSTLAKQIMALYGTKHRVMEEGRKQPIGYILPRREGTGLKSLGVVGHYEAACGGCDTISGYEKIFNLVRRTHEAGMDVLFEGLLISGDVKYTRMLLEEHLPLRVLALTTPIDVCIESINQRRRDKAASKVLRPDEVPDEVKPVNPVNTIAKHKTLLTCMAKLRGLGADCHEASREEALPLVRSWLGL